MLAPCATVPWFTSRAMDSGASCIVLAISDEFPAHRASMRMAAATPPPRTWTASPDAHGERAVEGLLVEDLDVVARAHAALGEPAQHLRVGVRDAHEAPGGAGLERLQRDAAARVGELEVGGRDRVAVGVAGRVAELLGDQVLEVLGEDVLEHLGLGVDAVPRHVEDLGEEQLDQPVVADDLERDAAARRR